MFLSRSIAPGAQCRRDWDRGQTSGIIGAVVRTSPESCNALRSSGAGREVTVAARTAARIDAGKAIALPGRGNPPHDLTSPDISVDADLNGIEAHCRLKAEASRRAAERQRRIHQPTGDLAEPEAEDPEIVPGPTI